MEELSPNLSPGTDDELLRLLLSDELFVLHQFIGPEPGPLPETMINSQVSTVEYSTDRPTMEEANEGASSFANMGHESILQERGSMLEKGLMSKIENKYTLKINGSENGMIDDGYKWRKYGQKSIKNNPFPRSYYRCTNPRCSAKKQVEKSSDEPNTFLVTYEGLHLHFTFLHLFPYQPHDPSYPPIKKPKKPILEAQETQAFGDPLPAIAPILPSPFTTGPQQMLVGTEASPQGLLEDVVPLLIRNPTISFPSSISSSSYPSSPLSPSSSSSSLSWSPTCSSFIDLRLN
ncbi:probable WRKY transcription factor 49 [Macadamia integrifolia]|uniref:probable WRKY transcription factor 49 n=1 Tax=Macadamia integrifolia TaxID=60698 RepID=UPI001C52AC2A|nr:probable WRKY transcription factor 49 [Macadamia integrifolia]